MIIEIGSWYDVRDSLEADDTDNYLLFEFLLPGMINTNLRNIFQALRERPIAVVGVLMILLLAGAFLLRDKLRPLIGSGSPPQIGIGTGKPLPKYIGRGIREIRETPEEVKLFTEDQKKVIHQKILDAAGSIDVNPDLLDPWLQLGFYKKVIGDYEGARDAWEYASQIRPQNVVSFKNLGELYWHYLPDYPRAEANLRKAIENEPKLIDSYVTLSDIYRYSWKEKINLADDVLLEGIQNNPGNRDLISYLARYYKETGDKQNAIKYYRELLRLDPADNDVIKELQKLGAQ